MKKFFIYLFMLLIGIYVIKKLATPDKKTETGNRGDTLSSKVSEFIPYEGTVRIVPDFCTSLDG